MMDITIDEIQMMARECALQHSGEESVADMIRAFNWLRANQVTVIDEDMILMLGRLVEPVANLNGYRKLPVFIDGREQGVRPDNISRAISQIVEAWHGDGIDDIADFYQHFETVHPFADGNGRVGFLLFNLVSIVYKKAPLAMPPEYVNH